MQSCSKVMTVEPVCCLPSDTVEEAAQLMRREDVGPIPVVQDRREMRLAGIVTDRDLVVKVLAEAQNGSDVLVEDVMTLDPVTCHPEDDLLIALAAMANNQVRRIPIVDDNGSLVGIIAQADIATRIEEPEEVAEVVTEVSQPL